MIIKHLQELQCKRCLHKWVPRKEEVFQCPKCKSARWNKEKTDEN